jgi:hypothetical protein
MDDDARGGRRQTGEYAISRDPVNHIQRERRA